VSTFYGKYRGTVSNNVDPEGTARVQVTCPAVFGDGRLNWALPASPFAGSGVGLVLVPPVGANVWVEFEGGDTRRPIWSGCFWDTPFSAPATPPLPQLKVLKTDCVTITLNDLPGAGGLTIEVNPPAVATPLKLALSSTGIEISNGAASIKLDPVSVNVNNGALQVL
jgi:hypothetical protein